VAKKLIGEAAPPGALMTIDDFCAWAKISRRQYYTMRSAGRGPVEIRLLGGTTRQHVRISREEAEDWARRMTQLATTAKEETNG
jgi:hypothetical protein